MLSQLPKLAFLRVPFRIVVSIHLESAPISYV
jgi:hypothetical protein